MDAYGDVKVQIQELEIANKQCEMRGKLDQARDDARANLDAINDELRPMLERDINQELERRATLLKEPVAPRLSFEPGPAYTYGVPGDDGTGTNHLALAMFDHSVLALTPLPFFIHDTPFMRESLKNGSAGSCTWRRLKPNKPSSRSTTKPSCTVTRKKSFASGQ